MEKYTEATRIGTQSRPRIYKTLLTWKNPSFVKKI